MLATASAQVCVPLGHSSLYFIFEDKIRMVEPPYIKRVTAFLRFYRATLRVSAVFAVARCPSVRP